MAVQDAKSEIITDLDASPVVKTNPTEVGGVLREAISTMALTATEAGGDANSVWRLLRVPSRARIVSVQLANDDLDSSGTPALAVDLGLYEVPDGSAKDQDFFASAITNLQAAQTAFQDETYESAVVGVEDYHKRLWEQLGESEDPEVNYDIALTVTTAAATGAAGDIVAKVQYIVDE